MRMRACALRVFTFICACLCLRSLRSLLLLLISFFFFFFFRLCLHSNSVQLIAVGGTKHLIRSVPVQAYPTAASFPCPAPAAALVPSPAPASSSHSSSESDLASASGDGIVAVISTEIIEVETATASVVETEDCVRQNENDQLYNSTREHLVMSCGVCGTMVSLIPPLLPAPCVLTALH